MKTLRLLHWPTAFVIALLNLAHQSGSAAPQVYAGPAASSSFLVDGAGALNAWGHNGNAQLGLGHYSSQPVPATAPFPTGVHAWRVVATATASFGGSSTYGIGDDDQLYAAGFAGFGVPSSEYLTLIPPPAGVGGWAAVAAGSLGWLAVSTNGPIYGSINGQISWSPRPGATRWTQVAVGSYRAPSELDLFALDNRGKIYGVYSGTAWFPSPTFVEIPVPPGATAWTNLTAGANFTLALANDGNLYGWGHNESGQLGLGFGFVSTNAPQKVALPAGKSGWKSVAAGRWHSMAVTTDGQLFAWGYDYDGQLGLGGDRTNRYSPVAVAGLTNVSAIAAGQAHSLAILSCKVVAWGRNTSGELGLGFTSPFYPIPIGSQFNYDICSTNPPSLPLISVTAADPDASQGTWLSNLGQPATNTGSFEFSRTIATAASLDVKFSVSGTASNGIDYFTIPSLVTIPAHSNSVSLLVIPAGGILAVDPSTAIVNLQTDPAYQLGNSTNAIVTIIQYQSDPVLPLPGGFMLRLFVGTNLNGHVFMIQSSTNLIDWSDLGTGTNTFGVVTVTETNRARFRQRFFRTLPLP